MKDMMDNVKDIRDDLKEGAKDTVQNVKDMASNAAASAKRAGARVGDMVQEEYGVCSEVCKEMLQKHPWKIVGAAVLVGLLLGKFLG